MSQKGYVIGEARLAGPAIPEFVKLAAVPTERRMGWRVSLYILARPGIGLPPHRM